MKIGHTNLIWTHLRNLRCIYEPNFIKICAAVWEKSKMCLMKIVNREYILRRPNLNKLETRFPGASLNQIWMISGQWLYSRLFIKWPKMHKITHNSMKNRGSTPTFNKLGMGPLKEHPQKTWSKSVHWFKRRNRKSKKAHADANNGHRAIARVTLTHWVWLKLKVLRLREHVINLVLLANVYWFLTSWETYIFIKHAYIFILFLSTGVDAATGGQILSPRLFITQ